LQTQLLDAKATFSLRNAVIENVVIVEPTLRAVHNATHASPVERYASMPPHGQTSRSWRAADPMSTRDLLPHIQRRELANVEEAKHHRAAQAATKSLDELELEGCRVGHRNGALAAELLQLAENNRSPVTEASFGKKFAGEITTLEQEIKMSRKKWKLMKGTASGIVGGSGIDWVRDERLRGIVLDSAEEEAAARI
jgi:hypothetical protein